VTGHSVNAGHHMQEEAPHQLIRARVDFLTPVND
jgi:hypothetical protein